MINGATVLVFLILAMMIALAVYGMAAGRRSTDES